MARDPSQRWVVSVRVIGESVALFGCNLGRRETDDPITIGWTLPMTLSPERFAINQGTMRRQWTLAQAISGLSRFGVRGIAIWPDKLAELGVRPAASMLHRHGMTVTGYCCGDLLDTSSTPALHTSVREARKRVDEAAEIGAQCLVAVAGGKVDAGRLTTVRARVEEGLAELLPYARSVGVPLAIEPIHPMRAADLCCINTLAQANAICGQLGAGSGVVVDTYHVWWDPDIVASVAAARGRILAFHLADWLQATTTLVAGRGMIGDGVIDFPHLARLVEAAGYSGFYEVEVLSEADWWQRPPEEVATTCVDRLRQLAAEMAGGNATANPLPRSQPNATRGTISTIQGT